MICEIGSEFWYDPAAFREFPDVNETLLAQSLGLDGKPVFTSSGRSACALLLQSIRPVKKTVYLPEYTCESVTAPFQKAGYDVYCYRVTDDLNIDLEQWWNQFDAIKPGVVLLHPYFGFDTIEKLRPQFDRIRSNDAILIEDVTHSLFSRFSREHQPDYTIASLRKWLGISDGGFVCHGLGRDALCPPADDDHQFVNLRQEAFVLKNEYITDGDLTKKTRFLSLFNQAEAVLDQSQIPCKMSTFSRKILKNTDWDFMRLQRCQNYRFLEREFRNFPSLFRPIFTVLPDNVCPLYMPIWLYGNRQSLREHLIEHRIYPPVHWPLPSLLKSGKMRTHDVYQHGLSIPCDQRYTPEHLGRIIEVLHGYKGK